MSYSPPKGQGALASQAAATTQAQGAASQRQALDDSLPPPPPVPGNAGQGGGSMLGAPAVPPEHLPPSPPPPPPVPTCPPPEVDPVPGELALIYFLFSKGMDNFNTFKTTTTASKKKLSKVLWSVVVLTLSSCYVFMPFDVFRSIKMNFNGSTI